MVLRGEETGNRTKAPFSGCLSQSGLGPVTDLNYFMILYPPDHKITGSSLKTQRLWGTCETGHPRPQQPLGPAPNDNITLPPKITSKQAAAQPKHPAPSPPDCLVQTHSPDRLIAWYKLTAPTAQCISLPPALALPWESKTKPLLSALSSLCDSFTARVTDHPNNRGSERVRVSPVVTQHLGGRTGIGPGLPSLSRRTAHFYGIHPLLGWNPTFVRVRD